MRNGSREVRDATSKPFYVNQKRCRLIRIERISSYFATEAENSENSENFRQLEFPLDGNRSSPEDPERVNSIKNG
jgi:hypothetical protein